MADRIAEEMNMIAETLLQAQALTAAMIYKHLGQVLAAGDGWSADRLLELAASMKRESRKMAHAPLAEIYVQQLNIFVEKMNQLHCAPELRLLDGGKPDSDDDGPAAA